MKNSEVKKGSQLTLGMLVALVAGNMIGAGVFLLPSELARIGNISFLALLVTAIGALSLTWVFTRLSMIVPRSGGPYVYVKEGLGEFLGFQTAYGYWVAAWVGNAAVVVAAIGYLEPFFPGLNQSILARCLISVSIIWALSYINLRGMSCSGRFQMITMILRLIPLLLVAAMGYRYFNPQHFTTNFNCSGHSDAQAMATATLLTMWIFLGLESATVPAESVDNPRRNIPLASMIGTLIAVVVYFISCGALFGMVPLEELAQSSAPFVLAGQRLLGDWGRWLVALGAIIASLGGLNGWILVAAQIPQAASKEGFFPRCFLQKNAIDNTPRNGIIISSSLMTILVLISNCWDTVTQFNAIITLATVFTVLSYFYMVIAGIIMLGRSYWKQHIGHLLCFVIALVYSGYAVMGAGLEVSSLVLMAILISVLGYMFYSLNKLV